MVGDTTIVGNEPDLSAGPLTVEPETTLVRLERIYEVFLEIVRIEFNSSLWSVKEHKMWY